MNGKLESVTVLIGLSIKGKSRAGIIHNVFSQEDYSKGRTVFATAEHGAFWMYFDPTFSPSEGLARRLQYLEPFDLSELPPDDHKIRVAASRHHYTE